MTAARPTWGQRFAPLVRAFHAYANWLVSISWKRFIALSILLLIVSAILKEIPPFTWTISEQVETLPTKVVIRTPKPPKPPAIPLPPGTALPPPAEPGVNINKRGGEDGDTLEISIGGHGVRITPRS